MIPICFFVFLRGGFFSSNGKKSDNLHLLSKLCNSAQFWPFHRKVQNDEKKCVQKNSRDGDIWDIFELHVAPPPFKTHAWHRKDGYLQYSNLLQHREIDLIKHHPFADLHICKHLLKYWKYLQHICKHLLKYLQIFSGTFANILKYWKFPPQMDFWLGDLRHVQLDWCACLNGESHFTDKLKIICLEIQNVFVIKLHNIFVKNTKYICSNHKIYLLKLRHIVQSLVSLISPKSRLLSLSCVMGRLCVTKKTILSDSWISSKNLYLWAEA